MFIGKKSKTTILTLKTFNIVMSIIGLTLLSFIVFSPFIPHNIKLNIEDVTTETIISPRFIELETETDKIKTEDLRNSRAALVEPIYSIDIDINKSIQTNILNFFTLAREYRAILEKQQPESPPIVIPKELTFIKKKNWIVIGNLDQKIFNQLEYITLQNTHIILNQELFKVDKRVIRQEIQNNIRI